MNHEIKFTGITHFPNDRECADGTLAYCHNLTTENGLEQARMPALLLPMPPGWRLLYIHRVRPEVQFIVSRTENGVVAVRHATEEQLRAFSGEEFGKLLGEYESVKDVAVMNDTLILATDSGLTYYLWRDGAYRSLGSKPPIAKITFGLKNIGVSRTEDEKLTLTIPDVLAPPFTLDNVASNTPRFADEFEGDPDLTTPLRRLTESAMAIINKELATKVTEKGMFHQPFFVRWAYRLFDGSHSWHSAPVLMLPTTCIPEMRLCLDDDTRDKENKIHSVGVDFITTACRLDYVLQEGSIKGLADWKDIVTGIDFYVSAPIYTFAADKPLKRDAFKKDLLRSVAEPFSFSKSTKVRHHRDGGILTVNCNGEYIVAPNSSATNRNENWIVNFQANPEFHSQLVDTCNFYKICSVDFDGIFKLKSASGYNPQPETPLDLDNEDLTNLTNRERLQDEYQSHFNLKPEILYVYNNRLDMAGITMEPPKVESFETMGAYQDNSGNIATSDVFIKVWSRINGEVVTSRWRESRQQVDFVHNHIPLYIYVPDPNAYLIQFYEIFNGGGAENVKIMELKLTPHSFLNGAYYYDKLRHNETLKLIRGQETKIGKECGCIEQKLYVSQVGNPFHFPLDGICTVGDGEIIGLSSATQALSEGQFGNFPLYAFTDKGVWALQVAASGFYSAVQPVTRDVAISKECITQLDNSVAFLSARGLNVLSGSTSKCVTSQAFSLYAGIDEQTASWAQKVYKTKGFNKSIPKHTWGEIVSRGRILYDYTGARLLVYVPGMSFCYVLSLISGMWSTCDYSIAQAIPSYPNAYAQIYKGGIGYLCDFSIPGELFPVGAMLTRPLKLAGTEDSFWPDLLKTIDRGQLTGDIEAGNVGTLLLGSRNLRGWHIVTASPNDKLRTFSGTPYKYFRVGICSCMGADESLSGAVLNTDVRYKGKLR